MTTAKPFLVVAGVACLLVPGTASAAAKSCGHSKPHGITGVKATNIGCAKAVKVAQKYNLLTFDRTALKGWSCKGRRASSSTEKVSCKKGARKVAFRSTYQVELPPAPAPPSANAGSAASTVPARRVRGGAYQHETGQRTTDDAIFFDVVGRGAKKRIANVVYRNDCLTHNAPSPRIRIAADGSFRRRYEHSGTVKVRLSGRFVSRTRAKGTLVIDEMGCKSRFAFTARRQ